MDHVDLTRPCQSLPKTLVSVEVTPQVSSALVQFLPISGTLQVIRSEKEKKILLVYDNYDLNWKSKTGSLAFFAPWTGSMFDEIFTDWC